jgi:serine protease Do
VLPHPVYAELTPGGTTTIADVAERVMPSVVSVTSSKTSRMPELPEGHPFRFFFGPGGPGMGPGGGREQREQGLGSGVVVAPGVIVTNNHVVEDATEIRVKSHDNRDYDVELVGADPKSDVAVLRVKGDASALRPLAMGDSSKLRPGEVVLAVGNPFGVGQTVTMGIVSAKGRSDLGIIDYEDFIQTDAAINPGNSGGALVSMAGELIGINTAILSRSGGYQGIGFAIPTEMARPIVDSLLSKGRVSRGWLGVGIQDIDQDLAAAMSLKSSQGVLVSDVGNGTPAAKAGLKRGDIVQEVNGRPVDSTGKLRNVIAAAGAESTVKLTVLRGDKRVTLDVALGEMPEDAASPGTQGSSPGKAPATLSGLALEPLTPQTRERFRVDPALRSGVVITRVERGTAAARAGLRPGDTLIEVNRKPVTTPEQVRAAWGANAGKVLLLVAREGRTQFVVVSP